MLRPDTVHKIVPDTSRQLTMRSGSKLCLFCNRSHRMRKEDCPAYGKICSICKKKNHFAVKCNNAKVHFLTSEYPDLDTADIHRPTDEAIYSLRGSTTQGTDVKCKLLIDGSEIVFQIDTGSSANMLPLHLARNVTPTAKTLIMWNGSTLKPTGVCNIPVTNIRDNTIYPVNFTVYDGDFMPILGLTTSLEMGLINVNEHKFLRVHAVSVLDSFSDVFDGGLGTLPGIHHLEESDTICPVTMPARRVPIALRPKLKSELDRLETLGVIAPVTEPTPWLSQIVVVAKKSGSIRLCIDPRELNKALLRERYTLPILEDCLHDMRESRIFSKVDLKSGYWHIQLDKESSMLTSFLTFQGRYRWLRLPFGTSVSSEIFQRQLLQALEGLSGVVCVADDVVIHGKTGEEHDYNLQEFLKRCREIGIKLNRDKLELRLNRITFMGHCISRDGLHVDPEKIAAIVDMKQPSDVSKLRSFLGLVNYLSKFLPRLTDISLPLRNLTKKDVPWNWSNVHQNAFNGIKSLISTAPVLAFYDPDKPLTLENDASNYGIGSALMQDGKPVAYASRSLSETETRYAQIEKEMLALVYGLTKFHQYTYGRHVHAITDHRPLVAILGKPLLRAPRRLQGMLLAAQAYTFDLQYKSGTAIPIADGLSRCPLSWKPQADTLSVNVISSVPVYESRLLVVKEATLHDPVLTQLKEVILKGWPNDKCHIPHPVRPYFSYRDELSLRDGVVVRGERVVIPTAMRSEVKRRIHAGHLGINSCLRRAREVVFWPGMSGEVRQFVEDCNVCATLPTKKQQPETLILHEVPARPWQKIGIDLFSVQGNNYLITVDYHSSFFEIDYLPETITTTVIHKLKHHFARYGIPDTAVSDNGPQFTAEAFSLFSKEWGFRHSTSSPGNSRSNGAGEAAVKIAKHLLKKCRMSKEDPYLGLLNLRNIPTENMSSSPAQRLLGRNTCTAIPTLCSHFQTKTGSQTMHENEKRKSKSAARMNTRRKDLRPLDVGDMVRMQPLRPHQELWQEGTILERKGRDYTVSSQGRSYRRNRQFIRASPRSSGIITPSSSASSSLLAHTQSPSQDNLCLSDNTPATLPYDNETTDEVPTTSPRQPSKNRVPDEVSATSSPVVTRFGRVVKRVERLNM